MKSKNHLPFLDFIRFIAAFTVLIVHVRHFTFVDYGLLPVSQKTIVNAAIYAVTRVGNEAVIVFFVLSGFLVGGNAAVRIKQRSFRVADYSIDRFVRIVLPLIPALILAGIIGWVVGDQFEPWTLVGNLLSLQGVVVPVFGSNAPLWSLSYEVWFYVLMGGIGLLVYRGKKLLLGIFILVLFMAIFTRLSVVYWFCWTLGAIAYVYRPTKFNPYSLLSSILLIFTSIILVELASPTASLNSAGWLEFLPPIEISQLMLAAALAILLQQVSLLTPSKGGVASKIDSLGSTLAASAYTLYLIHYPILVAGKYWGVKRAESISIESMRNFLVEMCLCMFVAWCVYECFEKHTAKVKTIIKEKVLPVNDAANVLEIDNRTFRLASTPHRPNHGGRT